MELHSDGEPSIIGAEEGCPSSHCTEGNDVDEYMVLNNILDEDMHIIIEYLDLKNIGETFHTTLCFKADLELIAKFFELPQTSGEKIEEVLYILFSNVAAR